MIPIQRTNKHWPAVGEFSWALVGLSGLGTDWLNGLSEWSESSEWQLNELLIFPMNCFCKSWKTSWYFVGVCGVWCVCACVFLLCFACVVLCIDIGVCRVCLTSRRCRAWGNWEFFLCQPMQLRCVQISFSKIPENSMFLKL